MPKQLPWFQSFSIAVIYNSYLVPNSVMTDEHFLRHLFSSTLLEALGLKDDSGVIYELINYRFKIESNNFCLHHCLPGSSPTMSSEIGTR